MAQDQIQEFESKACLPWFKLVNPNPKGTQTWKCRVCSNNYKQKDGSGYINLSRHLNTCKKDWKSEVLSTQKSACTQAFFQPKTQKFYGWMKFVVDNCLPISAVDQKSYREQSKYGSVGSQTLKKYIEAVTAVVEGKIATMLPPGGFGLVLDAWTDGTTHFIALFASCEIEKRLSTPLLTISPPFDETSFSALTFYDFIGDTLANSYSRSKKDILYIVADHASVNSALANMLGVPMIGCASHKYNLAVKETLSAYQNEIQVSLVQKLFTSDVCTYSPHCRLWPDS